MLNHWFLRQQNCFCLHLAGNTRGRTYAFVVVSYSNSCQTCRQTVDDQTIKKACFYSRQVHSQALGRERQIPSKPVTRLGFLKIKTLYWSRLRTLVSLATLLSPSV